MLEGEQMTSANSSARRTAESTAMLMVILTSLVMMWR